MKIVREPKRSTWDAPGPDDEAEKRGKQFRLAMAMADEIGLSDDMRYSLAQMIPGVDKDNGGSWKKLNDKQLHDMLCMMDGYVWITFLKQNQSALDQDSVTE